ncbi:putative ribonuclease H protein [Vitis vinifera]|uniref:Putative ribonuclease H protein n=1 Tax=Vitis vinifera TaxID=29760 RepID=A0A438EHN4_VITVI|nr:putative ribonuclease H protein [Vitis vinifera]
MSEGIVRSLGTGRFIDWRALNAEGAAGGILICWDKRVLDILDWEEGHFTLSCRFKTIENGATWVFTGVYGPFTKVEREERSSQRRISSVMRRFAKTMDDLELVDLPLQGGEFTWNGGLNNQAWARLDRFLVSQSWLDQFSGVTQSRGSASYRLAVKMKEIKKKLKVWNKEVFGRLETNKASALQQVDFWDRVEKEAHWRQHSREIWLREGDRNTGFFHRMASAHRRNNAMDIIKVNGEWLVEEQEVREGVVNSFQQMLSEDMVWKADIGRIQVSCISQQEAESLEIPFAEIEIHSALMEMSGDKAPGPNGFTVAFWQNAWEFTKEEIMEMFKEFHEHNSFVRSLNNTFLELIPKKSGAEDLGDFRPISLCVSSAKFSILVNGVPAGFFPSTRGLRQGDPLSPYLFVMGMEVLDVFIRRAVEEGYLSGCNIRGGSRTSLNISHLFFADDTIVFCEASKEQVSHLSWILFWFEAASGLRINLAKSEIIPVGEVEKILEMAAELGATSMWDGVEERVRRRLSLWKRQYISKGGRITLIKSTLASMPIYQMSIFRMPKSVAKRVEKTQRDFLWGGGNLEGKVHLVKWNVVCTEKHKGGLGLRRIATLNRALLGKWIWRFACENDNLWKQVITTKYGQEDYGWRSKKASEAVGVGVWKEIMKESEWYWENLAFLVGKGSKIKFWKDSWCTDTPLSQCFNHLFVLATHRDATIEDMWDQDSGQGDWNLVFCEGLQ